MLSFRFWTRSVFDLGRPMMPKMHSRIVTTITTVRHFKFCVMEWKCLLIRDCYDCAFLISPETRLATEPRVIWIFTLSGFTRSTSLSSSIATMVPIIPPDVTTSAPFCRPANIAFCCLRCFCIEDYLDTRVHVDLKGRNGRIIIDFADLDDLERIYIRISNPK